MDATVSVSRSACICVDCAFRTRRVELVESTSVSKLPGAGWAAKKVDVF